MFDLHAHLLPGIDDGPPDEAAAVALAREVVSGGVHTLAATPHFRPDHPRVRPAELRARVDALTSALSAAGAEITLVPGAEVDLAAALGASDDDLRLASYGQAGTDLLVETPYGELPPSFEELLFRLRARGYRILLAHPERSPTFQRNPARLRALVESGDALLQVTAAALASRSRRSRSRRLAAALVREGAAHVLASDAHHAGRERASLAEGVRAAEKLAPERARWLVEDAPAAILAGDPLPPAPTRTRRRLLRG